MQKGFEGDPSCNGISKKLQFYCIFDPFKMNLNFSFDAKTNQFDTRSPISTNFDRKYSDRWMIPCDMDHVKPEFLGYNQHPCHFNLLTLQGRR